MKKQTRNVLLNLATGVAIAATAAVMLVPTSASAQPSFGINVNPPGGPGGFSLRFGTPLPDPSIGISDSVCFYANTRYRGEGFCLEEGDSVRDLDVWADEISSFDNPDELDITVCTRTRFRGDCRTYTSGARSLGDFDDDIESIRIQ